VLVFVGVTLTNGVRVLVIEGVGVLVAVFDGLNPGVLLTELVGVFVGGGVSFGVFETDTVLVGVVVGVFDDVGVFVGGGDIAGVFVTEEVIVGVGVVVLVGVGVGLLLCTGTDEVKDGVSVLVGVGVVVVVVVGVGVLDGGGVSAGVLVTVGLGVLVGVLLGV